MSESAAETEPETISEVLDQPVEQTEGAEQVTIGDVLDSYGRRGYGPPLLLIALIELFPLIGGIPGVSLVTGTLIILLAAQLLFLKKHPWVPGRIRSIAVRRRTFQRAVGEARPWARWADRLVGPRLVFLTDPPFANLIALACIAHGLLFYPMTVVPWGVTVPAVAVALFGLALTARDGVLTLLGAALTGVAAWVAVSVWPF